MALNLKQLNKGGVTLKVKKILIDLGNVRICEYDNLNVQVVRLEEVFNPKTKQTETKWRFKGYFNTILSALKFISIQELLIDKNAVNNLKSYLKQVEESNERIKKAVSKC